MNLNNRTKEYLQFEQNLNYANKKHKAEQRRKMVSTVLGDHPHF